MKSSINRRQVLTGAAGAALAAGTVSSGRAASREQPNVLFIVADDLGYADLSCYGRREYRTPRIDSLASDGLKLTTGYANSAVCSASRTALITGRYQYRLKVGLYEPGGGGADYGIPEGHPTLPGLMRSQGYRTSLFGKWHLGVPPTYSPIHRGYDYYFGFLGGAIDYFRPRIERSAPPGGSPCNGPAMGGLPAPRADGGGDATSNSLFEGDTAVEVPGYLTDLLADRAAKEITACAKAGQRFFISLHFNAPHWPWEGPNDEAAAKSALGSGAGRDSGGSLAKYAEMVAALDNAVGRVLDQLKRSGVERDTIVIFTSDNGGERYSDDWPFIGSKGELLEGGLRIPLLVRWPAKIRAGRQSEQAMIHMDWLPTLLAVSGGTQNAGFPADGMNLLPQLLGQQAAVERKLYWRYHASDQAALREGDWKYLRLAGREYLFDLADDLHERANRRQAEPARFARLKQDWENWNATMLPYADGTLSWNPKTNCWADRY